MGQKAIKSKIKQFSKYTAYTLQISIAPKSPPPSNIPLFHTEREAIITNKHLYNASARDLNQKTHPHTRTHSRRQSLAHTICLHYPLIRSPATTNHHERVKKTVDRTAVFEETALINATMMVSRAVWWTLLMKRVASPMLITCTTHLLRSMSLWSECVSVKVCLCMCLFVCLERFCV